MRARRTAGWALAALTAGVGGTTVEAQSVVAPYLDVRIGPNTPAAQSAQPGTIDVPILQVVVTAVYGNMQVESVDLYPQGSGDTSSVVAVSLVEDVNGDGVRDPGDVLIADGFWTMDHWNFFLKGMAYLVEDSPEHWLFSFVLDSGAAVGATYGAAVFNTDTVHSFVANDGFETTYYTQFQPPGTETIRSRLVTVADASTSVVTVFPGGLAPDEYVMITPSIEVAGTGFDQIESQLGPPGPDGNWRLFRYNGATGTYDEYGAHAFPYMEMDPRLGWWFIARRGGSLTFTGTSTTQAELSTLSLPDAGVWVQIGNPFNGPLPLSFLSVDQGVGTAPLNSTGNTRTSQEAYRYAGGGYVAESVALRPATGYWIYVIAPTALQYTVPPNALKPGLVVSHERPLRDGEAAPPPPPSAFFEEGASSGGGPCFAGTAATGGMAGLLAMAAFGAAVGLRRKR